MKLGTVCVVLVVAVIVVVQNQETQNPGFRAIFTSKGLNYVHDRGLAILKEWLCNYSIPQINQTDQIRQANVTYTFDNIVIHSLDFGQSSLTSDTRGVVLNIKDVSFSFSTDFTFTEIDWPHFTDRISVDATAGEISFEISVSLMANNSNVTESDDDDDHFYLSLTSCKFDIAVADLVFKGGASYFYNLFGPGLGDIVRWELKRELCRKWLPKTINKDVNDKYLSKIPTILKVADGVEIDYTLVGDANFSTIDVVVTDHKGEFILKGVNATPSFDADPLPDFSTVSNESMVHIVISTYVVDSAAYAFWMAGQLAYNVTSDQLWIFKWTDAWCASTLVPQELCNKYSHSEVMLLLEVVDRPRMTITNQTSTRNQSAALSANASITMYLPELKESAFTVTFTAKGDVTPSFKKNENRICGTVSNARVYDMELPQSNIGQFDLTKLKDVIKNALLPLAVVYINTKYTQPGFPIPKKEGFSFINSSITFGEDSIILSTDFIYTPTFLSQNATCIYN